MRKDNLVNGEIYHICTKSIAGYKVFNSNEEFIRVIDLIKYYQTENDLSFSAFLRSKLVSQLGFGNALKKFSKNQPQIIQIIAYSIMPTHIHLALKQLSDNGISKFIANILNSYTRYFNIEHGRKGPLWEGRFKSVLVESDEQLLHLTRYQHLNAVTAGLVKKPEEWRFSSYKEYLGLDGIETICDFEGLLDINPKQYQKFVNDQISYQKELSLIKKLLLDS